MGFANILDAALPPAAVPVLAFLPGFRAIWPGVRNGLTGMHEELRIVGEHVARIEGRFDPRHPVAGE